MKKEEQQWIDQVFNSLDGSRRAKPKADLFAQIEARIQDSTALIFPIHQLRIRVAVAVLLLCCNALAMHQFSKTQNYTETIGDTDSTTILISNYNIYEK